ncbi:carbohydrate ABC transporter permease [Paenibacillus cymbidii]|uniref:carbohydrate ABC transporter permease n=1 Tax=Paenibacillus cymbidii TaxID=1639034 RepID=UPI001082199F|nr:carbohydrate ABC transporter permease [Paenibacillus cymbidii]
MVRGKKNVAKALLTLLLLVAAITMIVPFLWMISTSFKKPIDVFHYPIDWLPLPLKLDNYSRVWSGSYSFALFYWNSIKVTVLSVLGTIVVSSAAAYGFGRIRFAGRDAVFMLYIATLMIPDQVTLVPRFILFNYLGLYNTHGALILPGIFTAFGTFMLRQFYMTVPNELSEAAKMEGAGHLHIWSRIMVPLSKAAMISLVILSFAWTWNEFVNPLIFLTSKELYTVPLGLNNFVDESGTEYTLMMAAAVISVLPVMVVFIICQRWFVEGVISSGVKG